MDGRRRADRLGKALPHPRWSGSAQRGGDRETGRATAAGRANQDAPWLRGRTPPPASPAFPHRLWTANYCRI